MSRQAETLTESSVPLVPTATKYQPKAGGREAASEDAGELWQIVQRVFLAKQNENAPRAVAFCGVDHGVGTTSVCIKAAESLARESLGKVCLVDANLRAPSLHVRFNTRRAPGFVELISDSHPVSEFAQRVSDADLWLVPAGAPLAELNGSLNSRKLSARFAELRAEFDFILIDTPGVGLYRDALLLGRVADGIILVAACSSTRRETARSAKLSFESAQIPVLGAVLNKRTFPIPEVIYRRI